MTPVGPNVRSDAAGIRSRSTRSETAENSRSGRPHGPDSEQDEIARAQHDPRTFVPLYERYVDAIFGYCFHRTGDPDMAADLTSQIFAKAIGALPRYQIQERHGTFRSWLFSIAHNLVVDAHRTRRDHSSLDRIPDSRPLRDPSPSPEAHAIANEDRLTLARAMASLTGSQRQVVELRLAGLTGPEIAAVLNMHLAAVKSAQFRTYARLRTLLRPEFQSDEPTRTRTTQPTPHQEPTDV